MSMIINPYRFGGGGGGGGGGDPYWANVVLLLHCDGTDGSTTFTDSSGSAHTVTATGDAQIDTAEKKFGTGSGLFDGTGDYLTIPNSSDFNFGTDDWTIEFWCRFTSLTGYQTIFEHGYNASGGLIIQTGSGNGKFIVYTSGVARASSTASTPSVGTWYYYAIVQSGTTITIYRDGTSVGSGTSSENLSSAAATGVCGWAATGIATINAQIDDFRVTKGVARDVSIVPTSAFPDS